MMAIDRGVNYLNWCGHPDGMRDAIRQLGSRRSDVRIAIQFSARSADAARRELQASLTELQTDYIDVVTYYYVEHQDEWGVIVSSGGAAEVLEEARTAGTIRSIGLTSHQRALAASWAESGRLDLLMIRYNAAHRGAEDDVFPITNRLQLPVVAFTCLRWGTLMRKTPDDPNDFTPPSAADCYRFVLANPSVSVALMAPDGRDELVSNLDILDDWRLPSSEDHQRLCKHGDRVRRHAGHFP